MFKQLRRNPKLIKNFRYILKNIIKEVYIYSQTRNNEIYDLILTNKIYLSIPMIEEKINEKINEEKKIKEKNKVKNINNKKYKNQIKNKIINPEEITKKYFQNITKSFLEEKIEEYKNDNLLKEFCQFQLNSFNFSAFYFSAFINLSAFNKNKKIYTFCYRSNIKCREVKN